MLMYVDVVSGGYSYRVESTHVPFGLGWAGTVAFDAIQWWMQAASKSSQRGKVRGENLEDNCMTLHYTI